MSVSVKINLHMSSMGDNTCTLESMVSYQNPPRIKDQTRKLSPALLKTGDREKSQNSYCSQYSWKSPWLYCKIVTTLSSLVKADAKITDIQTAFRHEIDSTPSKPQLFTVKLINTLPREGLYNARLYLHKYSLITKL